MIVPHSRDGRFGRPRRPTRRALACGASAFVLALASVPLLAPAGAATDYNTFSGSRMASAKSLKNSAARAPSTTR